MKRGSKTVSEENFIKIIVNNMFYYNEILFSYQAIFLSYYLILNLIIFLLLIYIY